MRSGGSGSGEGGPWGTEGQATRHGELEPSLLPWQPPALPPSALVPRVSSSDGQEELRPAGLETGKAAGTARGCQGRRTNGR